MLLHPTEYKTEISGLKDGDIQPNATDIRLGRVWKIDNAGLVTLTDDNKIHARRFEVLTDDEDYYTLNVGTYEISFENAIKVAEGEAGWVITRSTLNRNGIFITSGLYDSGYGLNTENGSPMAACLHVKVPLKVKAGTRVAQYICVDSQSKGLYNGDYGNGSKHDLHLNS